MSIRFSERRRREGGAALLVAMLMLALMALIGFASMDTVMRDRQVAGNTSRHESAVHAADAALAGAIDVLRSEAVPPALPANYCLTGTVPTGTLTNNASYGPDSTVSPNQICLLAQTAEPCEGMPIDSGFVYTVWDVRTQGQAPGGAVARIQATATRCQGSKKGGY